MTNGEKYKSIDDRVYAFRRYCAETECPNCCIKPYEGAKHTMCVDRCILKWLALETEEKKTIPCPCCGAASAPKHGSDGFYYVQCGNCGLMTSNFDTKAEAIAMWNRRVKRK